MQTDEKVKKAIRRWLLGLLVEVIILGATIVVSLPVHEFGHVIPCYLYGVEVKEIAWDHSRCGTMPAFLLQPVLGFGAGLVILLTVIVLAAVGKERLVKHPNIGYLGVGVVIFQVINGALEVGFNQQYFILQGDILTIAGVFLVSWVVGMFVKKQLQQMV